MSMASMLFSLNPLSMFSTEPTMAMTKTFISIVGSVAAAAVVARSLARDYLPPEINDYLFFGIRSFLNRLFSQLTMVIYEFEGLLNNEIYDAAHVYLAARISPDTQRLKVTKPEKEHNIDVAVEFDEVMLDTYQGAKLKWVLVAKKKATREYQRYDDMTSTTRSDLRSFELTFHRKHKEMVLNHYLPFIVKEAKEKRQMEKTLKIFTVNTKPYSSKPISWTSVNLDHPATFDTLAMDPEIKLSVLKDLERFVRRREYYRKIGKAWKRGYLLYGPPGTGKSSLIAAMANHLKFDIYDLELTDIKSNSELRTLLLATANRSILVVEDIDCSVELHDREVGEAMAAKARRRRRGDYDQNEKKQVTLSGFLNFIDGLWSSCGDQRIIIFTTNRKEKLDFALLRPGRMDVHIHMSYCTPWGFKLLAANYLGIEYHMLFEEIEELIRTMEVTPAEIAEQLLKNDDPDVVIGGLVDYLHLKKKENEEAMAAKKLLEVKPVDKQQEDENQKDIDKDIEDETEDED